MMPQRRVLVGASSGLGAALLDTWAAAGHYLWAGARRPLQEWATSSAPAPDTVPRFAPRHLDAADPRQVAEFWAHIRWATSYVDALVVTVGTQGAIGALGQVDAAAWWDTVATNLYAPYLLGLHGLPLLQQAPHGGRILVCAGGGAFNAWPAYSGYAVAKAGLVRLVECWAAELADQHITVNAIAPGFMPTGIHATTLDAGPGLAGRSYADTLAALDDPAHTVGRAVACVDWLLSEAATGLTGKVVSANFDPWDRVPLQDLQAPDVLQLRRVNLAPVGVTA